MANTFYNSQYCEVGYILYQVGKIYSKMIINHMGGIHNFPWLILLNSCQHLPVKEMNMFKKNRIAWKFCFVMPIGFIFKKNRLYILFRPELTINTFVVIVFDCFWLCFDSETLPPSIGEIKKWCSVQWLNTLICQALYNNSVLKC